MTHAPADIHNMKRFYIDMCDQILDGLAGITPYSQRNLATLADALIPILRIEKHNPAEIERSRLITLAMGFHETDQQISLLAARLISMTRKERAPSPRQRKRPAQKTLEESYNLKERLTNLRAWIIKGGLESGTIHAPLPASLPNSHPQQTTTPPEPTSPRPAFRFRRRTTPRLPPLSPLTRGPTPGPSAASPEIIQAAWSAQKVERAQAEHQATLDILRAYLEHRSITALQSELIDLAFHTSEENCIVESKSLSGFNENEQVRAAFAQLHDYAYRYRDTAPFDAGRTHLWLILSTRPTDPWTRGFLGQYGVRLLWVQDGEVDGPDLALLAKITSIPTG